ncbi:MAG: DUF3298 domain-containing protein [Chloroflexota bacterium]
MKIYSPFILLLAASLACSTAAFPAPDPTAIPTSQPAATATPNPSLTIAPLVFNEEGESPPYTIEAEFPAFAETDDPRAAAFNTLIHDLVMREVDRFRNNTLQNASNPPVGMGSFFYVQYSVIGHAADFWSIKFEMMVRADGAVNAFTYSMPVNYDLQQGREIALAELFLPNSDYLQKLSDYCKAELSTLAIALDKETFVQGADPLPANYRSWNISHEGLVVTFDDYQYVTPTTGPQIITIPFGELEGIVDPESPVAPFLP